MITLSNEFFNINEFAQTARYMAISGSNVTKNIPVIFDTANAIHALNGITYRQESATAMCKADDVKDATNKSILKIDGTWYYVHEISDDGYGVVILTIGEDSIHG